MVHLSWWCVILSLVERIFTFKYVSHMIFFNCWRFLLTFDDWWSDTFWLVDQKYWRYLSMWLVDSWPGDMIVWMIDFKWIWYTNFQRFYVMYILCCWSILSCQKLLDRFDSLYFDLILILTICRLEVTWACMTKCHQINPY